MVGLVVIVREVPAWRLVWREAAVCGSTVRIAVGSGTGDVLGVEFEDGDLGAL